MDDHGLVDQVIVHADAAEELRHRVAQEPAQRQQGKGRGERQGGEAQGVDRAVDHLVPLDRHIFPRRRLDAQHPQEPDERQDEYGRRQRLPQVPAGGVFCLPFAQADIRRCREDPDNIHVQEIDQLVHHHAVVLQRPDAPGPEAEAQRAQERRRQRGLFHHGPGD